MAEITTLLAAGLNLAGIEQVLHLRSETQRLQGELDRLRAHTQQSDPTPNDPSRRGGDRMGEFAVTCRPQGGSDELLDICVAGPITRDTAGIARPPAPPHRGLPSPSSLRLNLSCCTSINVDGMLALSVAQHAARSRGRDLRLVEVPLIERQLRQHNFDDLLLDPTPDQHRDRHPRFSTGTDG